jgi:hypothetical protein
MTLSAFAPGKIFISFGSYFLIAGALGGCLDSFLGVGFFAGMGGVGFRVSA